MQSFERTGVSLYFTSNGEERAVEVYVHTHVYTVICLHMFV